MPTASIGLPPGETEATQLLAPGHSRQPKHLFSVCEWLLSGAGASELLAGRACLPLSLQAAVHAWRRPVELLQGMQVRLRPLQGSKHTLQSMALLNPCA